jgi:hypothetical protein
VANDDGPPRRVAAVIGLPDGVRARLEQRFSGTVVVHTILLRQKGGFQLQYPPDVAARHLEHFADEASSQEGSYQHLLIVALPYAEIPDAVKRTLSALEELGARVERPKPGNAPWPSRSPRLDEKFQTEVLDATAQVVEQAFPVPREADADEEVAFELLRGLASHSKMGPNNHSHEDDLWKARGKHLGPGGKGRIINHLLGSGLLDRKRNDSAGGKGWVYWIADVSGAKARFPGLAPYLG